MLLLKRLSILPALVSLALWPQAFCSAASRNLKDAFAPGGVLDIGAKGAGYDIGKRDIDPVIGNVILVVLSLLSVLFLALMIYSGYTWMTAMGDPKKVTKAKDMMLAAITGLIVITAAYMITYFVFVRLVQPSITI